MLYATVILALAISATQAFPWSYEGGALDRHGHSDWPANHRDLYHDKSPHASYRSESSDSSSSSSDDGSSSSSDDGSSSSSSDDGSSSSSDDGSSSSSSDDSDSSNESDETREVKPKPERSCKLSAIGSSIRDLIAYDSTLIKQLVNVGREVLGCAIRLGRCSREKVHQHICQIYKELQDKHQAYHELGENIRACLPF